MVTVDNPMSMAMSFMRTGPLRVRDRFALPLHAFVSALSPFILCQSPTFSDVEFTLQYPAKILNRLLQ